MRRALCIYFYARNFFTSWMYSTDRPTAKLWCCTMHEPRLNYNRRDAVDNFHCRLVQYFVHRPTEQIGVCLVKTFMLSTSIVFFDLRTDYSENCDSLWCEHWRRHGKEVRGKRCVRRAPNWSPRAEPGWGLGDEAPLAALIISEFILLKVCLLRCISLYWATKNCIGT